MGDEEPEEGGWFDKITDVPSKRAKVTIIDHDGKEIPVKGHNNKDLVITKTEEIDSNYSETIVEIDDGEKTRRCSISKFYPTLTGGSRLRYRAA